RSHPQPARRLSAVAEGRRAVPFENRHVAPAPAAASEGAREAVASAQPAAYGGADRVRADRVFARIERGPLRTRAAAFPRDVSQAAQTSPAALPQAAAQQRIPAHDDLKSPGAHAVIVFRAVPVAGLGRALRGPVPRSVSGAPLPGRPRAFARTSGVHLRGDGDVPAAVPD